MTTSEKQERAGLMYREGHSQQTIARTLGVAPNTVTAWKKRFGWGKPHVHGKRQQQREAAFLQFQTGASQQDIARTLGVSENTITTWKNRDEWVKRAALAKDTATHKALTLLGKLVQAQLSRYATEDDPTPAGPLRRAYAHVCRYLECPGLVNEYAPPDTESET